MNDTGNTTGGSECTECGEPAWWYAWSRKCRSHAEKAGQSASYEVDVDKVVAYFDGNLDQAKAFLVTTRYGS